MSFQIKYRAFSKSCKTMHQNVGYHPTLSQSLSADPDSGYQPGDEGSLILSPLMQNYVLMQYSNWKDKNGKEIYEGDVLECINADGDLITVVCELGKFPRQIYENKVEICGFYLRDIETNNKTLPIIDNYLGKHDLEILEVIGNIHESLELFSKCNQS